MLEWDFYHRYSFRTNSALSVYDVDVENIFKYLPYLIYVGMYILARFSDKN